MSPRQTTLHNAGAHHQEHGDRPPRKGLPLGWEGAEFPLSKLDLLRLSAGDSHRKAQPGRRSKSELPPVLGSGLHGSNTSANVRLFSKSRRGWSWLSIKFKGSKPRKWVKPRKGELAEELVKACWGVQDSLDTSRTLDPRRVSLDPAFEIKKICSRKRQHQSEAKTAENLMDILLQNWTYFEHAHGEMEMVEKHVHAKYCQNEFGHFLLSGDRQIHGQFYVLLHLLVSELRLLMTKLRSQILPAYYQELPSWRSPTLEESPELEIPPIPPMPQLYPIEGLAPILSEQDEDIPSDLLAPVFKPSTPRKHPAFVLPEPLKVPPLKLPIMHVLTEDESTIDYDAYKEEQVPVFTPPHEEPLPVWVEPELAQFPQEPLYLVPEVIPPPTLEPIPKFRLPLMDPRPCERAYYETGKDQKGVCDGLCSKHGHKHHFIPGHVRTEPCFAKPIPLLPFPPSPFPEAERIKLGSEDVNRLAPVSEDQNVFYNQMLADLCAKALEVGLPIKPEPSFDPPYEEPIPLFQPPTLKDEPIRMQLQSPTLPPWKEPKPPPPVGWLAGQRPVFLIDCGAAVGADRMESMQNCMKDLFSPGGQVEVAATHFDVIMYSFDAWSYGDIENSYLYKQASASRFSRPLEPMRRKTSEAVEGVLNWVSRWRVAGTSNLWKAINLALSRTLADCIYLFSEGKSDKPVLILESLRQQIQMQGYCIPIFTIGMHTSKPKMRFLKRLSAVTGGQFMEYNLRHDSHKEDQGETEEVQDMLWTQARVEAEQRQNAEIGRKENIKDIISGVEKQYEPARLVPRLQSYRQQIEDQEKLHNSQIQAVREENVQTALQAREFHEKTVVEIMERNASNLERAKATWQKEVEKIRQENKIMIEDFLKWTRMVDEVEQQNECIFKEAKQQYEKVLKDVEEQNATTMEKAKEQHAAEVKRIENRNQDELDDVARRQKEIDEKVATMNKASHEGYEAAVAAIEDSNAALWRRTQLLFEEQTSWVKSENERALREAHVCFVKLSKEVRAENARRKEALAQRLEEIKRTKDEAIATHRSDVAMAISQHEEKLKAYDAMNKENEAHTWTVWKRLCEEIDRENNAVGERVMCAFQAEQIRIQEENIKLAEKRLALKRQIAEVVRFNDELVKKKKVEWKEACAKVEQEYEKEVAKAIEGNKKLVEDVKKRNAERLQTSLVEHRSKVAAVMSYNETVRPYVEASNAVRTEVHRIEAFLQCIADSILPRDRHILEKNPTVSQLDKDLDLLAVSDVTLNTEILIEALRSAYGKNLKKDTQGEDGRLSQKMGAPCYEPRSLSGLIPINPVRAPTHSCLNNFNNTRISITTKH